MDSDSKLLNVQHESEKKNPGMTSSVYVPSFIFLLFLSVDLSMSKRRSITVVLGGHLFPPVESQWFMIRIATNIVLGIAKTTTIILKGFLLWFWFSFGLLVSDQLCRSSCTFSDGTRTMWKILQFLVWERRSSCHKSITEKIPRIRGGCHLNISASRNVASVFLAYLHGATRT